MRAVVETSGFGDRRRRRAGRCEQRVEFKVHRPMRHHRHGEDRGYRYGGGRRLRAPSDADGRGAENDESRERERIVPARQHQNHGDQEIDRQRDAGDMVDLAGTGGRTVEQTAHEERGDERETCNRVEHVRAERRGSAEIRIDSGKRP